MPSISLARFKEEAVVACKVCFPYIVSSHSRGGWGFQNTTDGCQMSREGVRRGYLSADKKGQRLA